MKNFFKRYKYLLLICALFLFTRFYKIDTIPASLYWDEASIGYNAYSVLKTGKDEWGEFLPLHFRAFGEFKLPVYIYSVVISEFIFGLTIFAVRLPAVIFGIFSVIGLYFLVLELTKKKSISLLSSFLFSITPWFFIFSRTGYEAVAGLTFFIWAIYFLIKSFKEKIYTYFSVILFILSMYSYNSFRILSVLVLLPFFIYSLIKKKNLKVLFISGLLLIISFVPLYKLYIKDSGLSRIQTVGTTKNIVSNYFNNFSFNYLFINGDTNPRSQLPGNGQLYLLDALFVLLGVIYILKLKNKNYYFILFLLLIAPIPAAITKENPHALRGILLSPMFSILSSFGIYYLFKSKRIVMTFVISLYLLFFANYFLKFISNYNLESKSAWQYEYKEIFKNTDSGCVSDEFAQPYIFALFYGADDEMQKIDPKEFIKTKELNPISDWGFSTVKSFGNYTFSKSCQTN